MTLDPSPLNREPEAFSALSAQGSGRCLIAVGILGGLALPLILGVFGMSEAGGGGPAIRILLSDGFDDDPIGAVPESVPGSVFISSGVGVLAGVVTDPACTIEVDGAIGDGMIGHVLRMSDLNVPEGAGHCEVIGIPVIPAGPGVVRVYFQLRAGKFYGDSFEMAVIDNRATPGTGRLAAIAIDSAGTLILDGKVTGGVITPGETYGFGIELVIDPNGPDSWSVRIRDSSSPNGAELWGPFPSIADGTEVTSVWFSTSDVGTGTYDLDELDIVTE